MGFKSHAFAFAAGAAVALYAVPEAREAVSSKLSSIIRPLQQPFTSDTRVRDRFPSLFQSSEQSQPLQYSDGTKVESWNYRGNTWPEEWPMFNQDGSYNRDYVRWLYRDRR